MYNEIKKIFSVTEYVEGFPKRDIGGFAEPLSCFNDVDSAMSGLDELEGEHTQVPDSPTRYNSSPESDTAESRNVLVTPRATKIRGRVPKTQTRTAPSVLPKKILTKGGDNPDSVAWFKGEYSNPKASVTKHYPSEFASDPRKLELINMMDISECDDSTRA